jgi:orotate phosphoribosyltransferase-like protein
MYQVLKFASSGIYSGEVAAEFETLEEANEYLKRKGKNWEAKGEDYFADYEENSNNMARLELYADSLADNLVYRVKFVPDEDNNEADDEF